MLINIKIDIYCPNCGNSSFKKLECYVYKCKNIECGGIYGLGNLINKKSFNKTIRKTKIKEI